MRRVVLIVISVMLACGATLAQSAASNVASDAVSAEIVSIDGSDYYLHAVAPGQTLYSLSKLYGVPVNRILADNASITDENALREGQVIRIYCEELPRQRIAGRKLQRTFAEHTVAPGDTAYAIARHYSLSIAALVQDNPGLDPTHLAEGQVLRIRKSEIGETSPRQIMSQMDNFASALSQASGGEYVYHVVEIGETIYSISRALGVDEKAITASNDVADGLKAGAMLKIPVGTQRSAPVVGMPYVRPDADSAPGDEFRDERAEENSVEQVDDYSAGRSEEFVPQHYRGALNVAMLLPLTTGSATPAASPAPLRVRKNFMEFYQGVRVAMEDLRLGGVTVELNLYDTQRSPERVAEIAASREFADADLVVGPVYEDDMEHVIVASRRMGIPVVSPLATMEADHGNTFYQMPPAAGSKYDKVVPLLEGDKNVVLVTTSNTDAEFEREMTAITAAIPVQRVVYRKGMPSRAIESLMDKKRDNVFVVLAADEVGVDLILATLSSIQNNRLARSGSLGRISVVGDSRWARYVNLDKNLLFKLNVSFTSSYHADRSAPAVIDFDKRYIEAFGEIPTLYSYRGYDTMILFGKALASNRGGSLTDRLNEVDVPLQTPYEFVDARRIDFFDDPAMQPSRQPETEPHAMREDASGNPNLLITYVTSETRRSGTVNTRWVLVNYRSDYTITVE